MHYYICEECEEPCLLVVPEPARTPAHCPYRYPQVRWKEIDFEEFLKIHNGEDDK